jgi:hypothetical protein
MAAPVLLVADDLSLIASVKRVLAREGLECVLATSAADAVIGFGHSLPGLVLLQPTVETDRGVVVLEELQQHPDAQLLKVVLLGETIPGFPWPVEPLPLDGAHFAQTIEDNFRSSDSAASWSVLETTTPATPTDADPGPTQRDDWRATPPTDEIAPADTDEVPEPVAISSDTPPPHQSSPSAMALEDRLFGDLPSIEDELHRDVEAAAMASVESSLAAAAKDEELQRLEDEVRAEAQRRRQARESEPLPDSAPTPPPLPEPATTTTDEESFATLGGESTPSSLTAGPRTSQAPTVLARAEHILHEARAVADAQQRVDEADVRQRTAEVEAVNRRAEHAESLVRREREQRSGLEDEVERLRESNAELERARDAERAALEHDRATMLQAMEDERASHAAALQSMHLTADARLGEREGALTEQLLAAQRRLESLTSELERAQYEASTANLALKAREDALTEVTRRRDEKIAELTRTREERLAELNRQQGEAISALTRRNDERQGELKRQLAEALAAVDIARADAAGAAALTTALEKEQAAHDATRVALTDALAKVVELETENTLVEDARTGAELARMAADEAREKSDAEREALKKRVVALEADVASATELVDEASLQRQQLQKDCATLQATLGEAKSAVAKQEAEKSELRDELERANARMSAAVKELAALKDSLDTTRTRAEEAEATATLVTEKVKELESKNTMPLSLPGRRALGVARHGTVDLAGTAKLLCQLVLTQADLRLELGAAGGTRTLWLKKGQIIAAVSSFEAESLIDRARRDGLIDGRQEAELRLLRTATLREQLEALKGRGFIRDIESVPLVQRCAEQIALAALSEDSTQYRLSDEPVPGDVMPVTVPRATLPLLAEALRRSVPVDVLLEQLGGGEAVPSTTDSELDLRALGFSERERKMLTWVDGEATVEDVSLASGLKPETAFRALLVARLLGVIELKVPETPRPPIDVDLDLRRLEAKYDEVRDADYFTILGLPRGASSEDVQRAWQRLSTEFHPLRFSGHPDAGLQQRAQVVYGLLEEATRALEDDRRRVEYARHLLD